MIKIDKLILLKLKSILLNDTIWSVIGVVFGVICAFVNYFGDNVEKATYWIVCALVCIMNLKETPR